MVVSACGASSKRDVGEGDGGTDSGGGGQGGTSSGSGGSAASSGKGGSATGGTGTGGSGTGGANAGSGGCGPCIRIACAPPIWLTVVPDADAGASSIADLEVDLPGVMLSCYASGGASSCQWVCQSFLTVPSGHYTATVSAPGFESQTVEFDIVAPTNCGCCGCPCGGSIQETVALRPTGAAVAGCCASLQTDPTNCGACGRTCAVGSCRDGKCGPSYGQCLAGGGGLASCDAYCESVGLSCSAACGNNADQAMQEWVGGVANCGGDPNVTPRSGTCSEAFASTGVNGGRADYQCCCEER